MAINYNFGWDPIKARDNPDKHGVAFSQSELFQLGKLPDKKPKKYGE